jgi:CBS domain containing-hemolysin-like protein
MKFVYALLALGVLKCIILFKVYRSIPALELKRRAKTADRRAAALHRVSAYGKSVDVLLWLVGTACFIPLVIWSARTDWRLAAAMMLVSAWLMVWGKFPANGWAGGVAAFAAPVYVKIFYYLEPLLSRLARLFPSNLPQHTGLYERKDLVELLGTQYKQADNRIPETDLKIAYNSIVFGDKTVGKIMTPLSKVKLVGANDAIGPMLMDELHKTGFSSFPVVKDTAKSAKMEIIGTLYLNDLIGYDGGGKVKDLASSKVDFINEDDNLRQVLSAFLKTHHHLLIVINSFEEVVGVISMEDVLEQILGKKLTAEPEAEPVQDAAKPEQPDQTVVE